jgi:two-component system, sensor histidine kinase RegB
MNNPALEPRHNWRILLQLRAVTIMGQGAAVLFLFLFFESDTDISMMAAIIAVYAMINGILWVQLRNPDLPGHRSYFAQLLLDVAELSAMFYLTGGSENPFVFYYLVPISIAAVVLPIKYALSLTAFCIVAFAFLMRTSIPLPEFNEVHMNLTLSEMGMLFNFVMSALFITGFLNHFVGYMKRRYKWVSKSREHLLQDEQILAIATHAAGTAHELGTPMNNMKLIVEELIADAKGDAALMEDIHQLRKQIDLCTEILRNLGQEAEINTHWHNDVIQATDYIDHVFDKWRLLKPQVTMVVSIPEGKSPNIRVDPTLDQAFLNLLNNAAEANPEDIHIDVQWDTDTLTMKITDHGAGISSQVLERLGQRLTTTKDGMGIGFFLSNASVSRRGGTVALYPVEEGGTLTEITLPLVQS